MEKRKRKKKSEFFYHNKVFGVRAHALIGKGKKFRAAI